MESPRCAREESDRSEMKVETQELEGALMWRLLGIAPTMTSVKQGPKQSQAKSKASSSSSISSWQSTEKKELPCLKCIRL